MFWQFNPDLGFWYDRAGLYEKLGDIHQAMGHMEEALKYLLKKDLELTKELYESNPRNESLKNGLAIIIFQIRRYPSGNGTHGRSP